MKTTIEIADAPLADAKTVVSRLAEGLAPWAPDHRGTADRDFAGFPESKTHNPLLGS
jgi:hypothetical protein